MIAKVTMEETNKSTGIRVFVYGTLKKGHGNSIYLENDDFLGRAYVEGPFIMLDLGFYPAVIRGKVRDTIPNSRIFGEVYRISHDTLDSLDILEGNGRLYQREKIQTPFKQAWIYLLSPTYTKHINTEKARLHDGVWRPTEEEKEFAKQANSKS